MASKVCRTCKIKKPLCDFPINNRWVDTQCRECKKQYCKDYYSQTKYTVERYTSGMASTIRQRTNNPTGRNSNYKGVECKIGNTHRDVRKYLIDNFKDDIQKFIDLGLTPSIDRIDATKHYEHGNIQIIELSENVRKGSYNGGMKFSKRVLVTFKDHIYLFCSLAECSRKLKLNKSTITKYSSLKLPYKGFRFIILPNRSDLSEQVQNWNTCRTKS